MPRLRALSVSWPPRILGGFASNGLRAAVVSVAVVSCALMLAVGGCDRADAVAATPRTVEFVVEGMHCDSCSAAIEHRLADIAGVTGSRVDHEQGTASVAIASADPQIDAKLAEAIASLGFVVRIPSASPPVADAAE